MKVRNEKREFEEVHNKQEINELINNLPIENAEVIFENTAGTQTNFNIYTRTKDRYKKLKCYYFYLDNENNKVYDMKELEIQDGNQRILLQGGWWVAGNEYDAYNLGLIFEEKVVGEGPGNTYTPVKFGHKATLIHTPTNGITVGNGNPIKLYKIEGIS